MKLGIIADTHDNIESTRKAIEFFQDQDVDSVVHCGDMVAPFTAELFESKSFDFYAVRGNNDGEWNLKETVEEFGEFYNNVAKLEFQCNRIAVYHGTDEAIVTGLVQSSSYEYVLRGHTHQKKIYDHGGTVEINPGGIKLTDQEEEFHVATLDLDDGDVELHGIEE